MVHCQIWQEIYRTDVFRLTKHQEMVLINRGTEVLEALAWVSSNSGNMLLLEFLELLKYFVNHGLS